MRGYDFLPRKLWPPMKCIYLKQYDLSMNPGMTWCREMSTLPAGYIPQHKVTSVSSSGSLGFIVCVKCCRMVDSVPRWQLSLSWPIQSDHLSIADQMIPPLGREHSHGKTQYISGKQVLVRSRLWKIYYLVVLPVIFKKILMMRHVLLYS